MLVYLIAVISCVLTGHNAYADKYALVIGNNKYSEAPLSNPVNDARLMQQTLQKLGFKVTKLENAEYREMKAAILDFGTVAKNAEVALFYFAGHGVQDDRRANWLLPVDAKVKKQADLDLEGLPVLSLISQIEQSDARVGLVILDACRNNPYERTRQGNSRGLSRENAPSGTIIAYATEPDNTANDGDGENGLYTKHLAKYLGEPGLEIKKVFEKTAIAVEKESNRKQRPREDIGLRGDFYLASAVNNSGSSSQPQTQAAASKKVIVETNDWVAGRQFRDCEGCPEMVVIPSGNFWMGRSADDQRLPNNAGWKKTDSELPRRLVNISSFAIGTKEVSKGEFALFVRSTGYLTEAEKGDGCFVYFLWEKVKDRSRSWRNVGFAQDDDHPVVCVSWKDAMAYVRWLSEKTGKGYRLPSEAEWEYAARAGSQTMFWWGNSIDTSQANYDGSSAFNGGSRSEDRPKTVPVDSFSANTFGVYNVHGNVWEWVQDCWNKSYQGAPTDGRAWESGECNSRVIRGGGWNAVPENLRSAIRFGDITELSINDNGFRVARTR